MILQTKNGHEWNGTVGYSDKLRVANILDPIHDTLDSTVFKGTEPRPQKVSFIYNHFMDAVREIVPTPEGYFDLYLTGSLTTYQYSQNSDCDISIFPHYDQLIDVMGFTDANQVRRDLVAFVIDKVDGAILPGTTHPIQNFVVADGVSLTQMYHQGLRSAWSFQDHQWVVQPEKDRAHDISIELPLMFLRARAMADKMRIALDTDPELAKRLFHRIHTKRSQDQQKGLGDFAESNIIYKYLLNQGLFDRLKEIGVYIAKTAGQKDKQRFVYDPSDNQIYWAGFDRWGRPREHYDIYEEYPHLDQGEGSRAFSPTVMGIYDSLDRSIWLWNQRDNPEIDAQIRAAIQQSPPIIHRVGAIDEPMQVIYDFQGDHIILGDKESATLPNTIIVGTYDQGHVTLNHHAHQWLNTAYFKKLWQHSFPTYPLNAVSIMDEVGPKRIALHANDISYNQAFMYVGEPYDELLMYGESMHYQLIERFMKANGLIDEAQIEELPFILGHVGIVYPASYEDGGLPIPSQSFDQWEAQLPHAVVFDSHTSGYLNTDPSIKPKALAAIREQYPNTTDVTGRVDTRWWKGGAVLPEQLVLELPAEQLVLDLDKTTIPESEPEPKERGSIKYFGAFVYLGRPEHELLFGGSEHAELVEQWISDTAIGLGDNGMGMEEAEDEAWRRFNSSPQVYGHSGIEEIGNGVLREEIGEWAVFYSDYKNVGNQQGLKNEALYLIRSLTPLKKVEEADYYVYDAQWYQGG